MKNFIIEYTLKSKSGTVLKSGKVKAKNKINSFDAQVKFEDYLKKNHNDFGQLIVHSCNEDFLGYLDDIINHLKT